MDAVGRGDRRDDAGCRVHLHALKNRDVVKPDHRRLRRRLSRTAVTQRAGVLEHDLALLFELGQRPATSYRSTLWRPRLSPGSTSISERSFAEN
jgi:hypothetical protein